MNFPHVATVIYLDGKKRLVFRNPVEYHAHIQHNFDGGDKVWVTVEKPHKDKTHRQFRYLYGAIYPLIAEELGCTIEETDGIMRRRLLIVNPDSPLEYIRNKSDLNRAELAEFVDGVRREAAMLGINTPDPLEDSDARK